MDRRRLLVTLGGALAALTGLACDFNKGADQPTKDDPFPNNPHNTPEAAKAGDPPPPWPAQEDFDAQNKVITFSAWVEPQFGPYYVKLSAVDFDSHQESHNGAPGDDPRGQRVEGGHQFRYTLIYPTHHNVSVDMTVTASKPGSQKGYANMRDGKRYTRTATFGGTTVASLSGIRTQR